MDGRTGTPDQPRGLPVTGTGFVLPAAIWALYFAAVYSIQGAGCADAVEPPGPEGFGPLRVVLLLLTLAAAGAIALMGLLSYRTWRHLRPQRSPKSAPDRDTALERATFLAQGTMLNAGLFLVATSWTGLPILLFDPCLGHTLW